MTPLKQHIADGPYTVHKGIVVDRNKSVVRKDTCAEALNFPARVLEVLREEIKGARECGIDNYADIITSLAVSIGFSREDITQ